MDRQQAERLVAAYHNWYHIYEIFPGVTTPGINNAGFVWDKLQLPADLRGMRALDIGSADGFFTRQMVEAGAEVVAVDYRPKTANGMGILEQIIGPRFTFHHANFYEIPGLALGRFDIVLFLGIIYHLPDMCRAIDIVHELSAGRMFLESHVEPGGTEPMARYLPADSLNNDMTNFWAPNVPCLHAMLDDAGFAVLRTETFGSRALIETEAGTRSDKFRLGYGRF